MTDIRTRLAAAVKHHLFNEAGREQHSMEVADVLLSLPGIAIVEVASSGIVKFDHGWFKVDGIEADLFDSDQLRRCAAALLAAANAAEQAAVS